MNRTTEADATSAILQPTWTARGRGSIDTTSRSKAPSATYRELCLKGFGPNEAGNLTAYLSGIPPVESDWRPREIERLLFMRYLVERGWGHARADT